MPDPGTVGPSSTSGPVGGAPQRLRGGVLGMADIAAATMANVGPAMSFFFGFAFLATTAGVASPLTIVAAGVAVALLGNTLAEFSRAHPSAGSFITFVGRTFGPVSAVTTALLAGLGYIIAMASVIAISGGFVQITLNHYTGVDLPWIIWTLLLTGLSVVLMLRGIVVSTKWAGYFFGVEMLVLVVVSVATIVEHRGDLSAAPFLPGHLTHGFKGLAAASRWRCTCSSAGRTRPHSPRRRRTHGATSAAPCSPPSRS